MALRHIPLLPLLLLACAEDLDPYTRAGSWRPTGINERNLRVMVAQPRELVRGTGAVGTDGQQAADAVARLRTDRVRALPDSSIVRLGTGGTP
ncbi:hypothetical protein [Muricoccus radiodurans]|uniref:hypothetical protein n=1 Tax=Muricoccus radiodurans TaxID=2231721 RepID=UPI003CF2BBF0